VGGCPIYSRLAVSYNSSGVLTPLPGSQTETHGSSATGWVPETEAERSAIREQLERILASSLFKNSKRYPNLLRFVVERALEGHTEPLKERTLGIEVFGREPDYDTNLDPVVRTTAVEIRKRIAQYYHEASHESEIRIEFPPGTYMPEFRMPPKPAVSVPPPKPATKSHARAMMLTGASVLALIVAALMTVRSKPTALDRFWAPAFASGEPISLYIGSDNKNARDAVTVLDLMHSESVAFSDATALAKLTSLLVEKNKPYRIRLQPSADLEDLKDGPAVLIGGFNNSFVLRLTGTLRFGFVRNGETHVNYIQDRKNPESTQWSELVSAPYMDMKHDYAIICRLVDPSTGKLVVTASGLAKYGTEVAGEFLTSPAALEQIDRMAPKGWEQKSLEIVLVTDVVGRRAGTPKVAAVEAW
jgi:hypothetical protein